MGRRKKAGGKFSTPAQAQEPSTHTFHQRRYAERKSARPGFSRAINMRGPPMNGFASVASLFCHESIPSPYPANSFGSVSPAAQDCATNGSLSRPRPPIVLPLQVLDRAEDATTSPTGIFASDVAFFFLLLARSSGLLLLLALIPALVRRHPGCRKSVGRTPEGHNGRLICQKPQSDEHLRPGREDIGYSAVCIISEIAVGGSLLESTETSKISSVAESRQGSS